MTFESDFGDPSITFPSAVNDYRLTLFITSSSIIIIALITIIGAVSCVILCNEDEEMKEAEIVLDTPTREAYQEIITAFKEGRDPIIPASDSSDELTVMIDAESPMKSSDQYQDDETIKIEYTQYTDQMAGYPSQSSTYLSGAYPYTGDSTSPFHHSNPTPLIKRSLFSVLEEESSQLPISSHMNSKGVLPLSEGYSTKEDEFSNLIGLDETTELTLNQLEADFARMRKTSERRKQAQRSRAERMSFSEWTQKSKENQFQSPSPHRRKSFMSRLKRIPSDRKGDLPLGLGDKRRPKEGTNCLSNSLPVIKVSEETEAPISGSGLEVLTVPGLKSPKPVFHCEPIVRVVASSSHSQPIKQVTIEKRSACIQTDPLPEPIPKHVSPPPKRPRRLCTHCLEKYTSPKRQQLTFLERKRFFESMATPNHN